MTEKIKKIEVVEDCSPKEVILKQVVPLNGSEREVNGYINIFESGVSSKKQTARYNFSDIIGESEQINQMKDLARKASENDYNVLINGQSGTGKELFAQAIHNASLRSSAPFVAINCGAVPENLIESELFGYVPGAFTGARSEGHQGKFEQAAGGTLFLDEIGEMPGKIQVKLLRVLEEGELMRIGGEELISVDVRIIAATNKDLKKSLKQGSFRKDLFWRLNVINIEIPPLCQRQEDIEILFNYFLKKHSKTPPPSVAPGVISRLKKYEWPGNVRELENVVKKVLLFYQGEKIQESDMPDYISSNSDEESPLSENMTLREAEKELISRALFRNDGNLSQAARELDISRNTIYSKIDKLDIKRC